MKVAVISMISILLSSTIALGQERGFPKAKVDYMDFKQLVDEVKGHREERLLGLDAFLEKGKDSEVIILDTRSKYHFDRIHVKGAKHLSFSDFTQDNLSELVPSFDTTILIYCNNNFEGNQIDFATKSVVPDESARGSFLSGVRPLTMALNIPTYINLYGYGYRNVYELHELVNVNDKRIMFEGAEVSPMSSFIKSMPIPQTE